MLLLNDAINLDLIAPLRYSSAPRFNFLPAYSIDFMQAVKEPPPNGAAAKDLPSKEPARVKPLLPRGAMPPRMRALHITTAHRTGAWLAEAFANDSASEVILEEAIGATAGLARLRDEVFDMLLVSHEPGELDALDFAQGLRAGGHDEPILILGNQSEQELTALAFEVNADAYLCVHSSTTRTLLWTAARAIERHTLLRDNRRLLQADRQRLQQEHLEADRLLAEQRALITDLELLSSDLEVVPKSQPIAISVADALGGIPAPHFIPETGKSKLHRSAIPAIEPAVSDAPISSHRSGELVRLPPKLAEHYRELLRAYVIMGSGNLTCEMRELSNLLATTGVTPQQTMLLHLQVLEELIRGLGSRSARHVMTRADWLVLEMMIHVAEGYRERYLECKHPPQQQCLPGFAE